MKITLEQAVLGYQALQRVGGEKFPIKLAYLVQRNMRILQPDVKAYEEQRVELIKNKYGVKGEDEAWNVPPEKASAFTKQLTSMGSVELDLDIHTIDINSINMNIAPNDLFVLDWMFVFSEEGTQTPGKKKREAHKKGKGFPPGKEMEG